MMRPESDSKQALQAARAAFAAKAWTSAYTRLVEADRAAPLGAEDLERLAISAFLVGEDDVSASTWIRAHNEHLRRRDELRAARCVFWLALDFLGKGEVSQANGWLARGQRLVELHGDSAERGLLLVLHARLGIDRSDLAAAGEMAQRAVTLADRLRDPDLDVFARLVLAQWRVRMGGAEDAGVLLDEIMVASTVSDVSAIAIGTVYCAVIDACHTLFDFGRARQWTAALSRWCQAQPDLVPFRGVCLVHRAEIMRLTGDWIEAEAEAEQACAWLSGAARRGAAHYQIAEIRRMRGDFAGAERAYRSASECGYPPEPGLALLRLAEGRVEEAAATIRRALAERQAPPLRAQLLAACAEIMIARRDLVPARQAADELAHGVAAGGNRPYLRGLSGQTAGRVLLAEGQPRAALAPLREAWIAWQELEAPYEAARVRVMLGACCRALGDEVTARAEFEAAHKIFERLSAVADLTCLDALSERPPVSESHGLTMRERQVITLLATGKTNRGIAHDLGISERTVDRHVSNILGKLRLPSRSAATAYAYEHHLV